MLFFKPKKKNNTLKIVAIVAGSVVALSAIALLVIKICKKCCAAKECVCDSWDGYDDVSIDEISDAGEAIDVDGDGVADAVPVDVDGDGEADALLVDTTGDGKVDTVICK